MPEQEYDLFLSYATEDREWATMLAERLRSSGVRVWFDVWELQPGDHIKKLNDGLKHSRKVVAVWTTNYFRDDEVWTLAESYAKQDKDLLARERPLIPLLRQNCDYCFGPSAWLDWLLDGRFDARPRRHALSGIHGDGRLDVLSGGITGQGILFARSRRRSAGQIHKLKYWSKDFSRKACAVHRSGNNGHEIFLSANKET